MYCDIRLRLIDSNSDNETHVGIGPGLIQLLEEINEAHKVSIAASKMEMSLSKCWKIIRSFEKSTGKILVESISGGAGGGKTSLTPYALNLIETFRQIEEVAYKEANAELDKIVNNL